MTDFSADEMLTRIERALRENSRRFAAATAKKQMLKSKPKSARASPSRISRPNNRGRRA